MADKSFPGIRGYRSTEYDIYRRDRDHYRGRHFLIARDDWKEHRKAEKEERKQHKGWRYDND